MADKKICVFCNGSKRIQFQYRGEYCLDIAEEDCPCIIIERLAGEVERLEKDKCRIDFLENETYDLRTVEEPTGGDDADVAWEIISFHMAEPNERQESYGKTIREAIDQAITTHLTDKV